MNTQYVEITTVCNDCSYVDTFTSENMDKKVGDIWDQDCPNTGCDGHLALITAIIR